MPPETYVTTHIHTDGPIPGPHSLLTLTSLAHPTDGRPTSAFAVNVRELPGAGPHPAALRHWRSRPEDWLTTRRAARPPAVATDAYARWAAALGRTALVVDTADPDYVFLYWYLQRFSGTWPFARTLSDAGLRARLTRSTPCALAGCAAPEVALAPSG